MALFQAMCGDNAAVIGNVRQKDKMCAHLVHIDQQTWQSSGGYSKCAVIVHLPHIWHLTNGAKLDDYDTNPMYTKYAM